MKIENCEKALRDVRRFTCLARSTDDGAMRADYYRLAESCRDRAKDAAPSSDSWSAAPRQPSREPSSRHGPYPDRCS
jgi:hypothetical protein